MSNNKQSSLEWLQAIELERDLTLADWNKAKAMHKEEVTSFTADWSVQYKYENGKNINQFYNETFGGNNEQQ